MESAGVTAFFIWTGVIGAACFGFGRYDMAKEVRNECTAKQMIVVQDTRVECRPISMQINGTEVELRTKEKQ